MDATASSTWQLPDIRHDLGASLTGLQWVIDAYTIVVASFLILGGSTADRFGRRRVFQIKELSLFPRWARCCAVSPLGWARWWPRG